MANLRDVAPASYGRTRNGRNRSSTAAVSAARSLMRRVSNASLSINGPELHQDVGRLARAANFAAVSTLLADGQPQTHGTCVDVNTDASHLLVNTLPFTQKFRNVRRDPRITVLIWDREDPER